MRINSIAEGNAGRRLGILMSALYHAAQQPCLAQSMVFLLAFCEHRNPSEGCNWCFVKKEKAAWIEMGFYFIMIV